MSPARSARKKKAPDFPLTIPEGTFGVMLPPAADFPFQLEMKMYGEHGDYFVLLGVFPDALQAETACVNLRALEKAGTYPRIYRTVDRRTGGILDL